MKFDNLALYIPIKEALISNSELGEGRMIPSIILYNPNMDKTVENLARIHKDISSGDVTTTWRSPINPLIRNRYWELLLQFSSPLKCEFVIRFELDRDYRIIEAIIQSRGLYIGYGDSTTTISLNDNPIFLIEVPDNKADKIWRRKLDDILKKKHKKLNKKENSKDIRKLIAQEITELNKIFAFQNNKK